MEEEALQVAEAKDISIKVKGQDGVEVFFKLKPRTKMKKVFKAYYLKTHQTPGTVRFVFDGKRMREGDTVLSLGLQNNDVIEAMVEQTGGLLTL